MSDWQYVYEHLTATMKKVNCDIKASSQMNSLCINNGHFYKSNLGSPKVSIIHCTSWIYSNSYQIACAFK